MKNLIILIFFIGSNLFAQFPSITKGDFVENDKRFQNPINISKEGELTIASFNIRNLGNRNRTLKDYQRLVDLVDEADIVVFQEIGLGLFSSGYGGKEKKKINAIRNIFQSFFGNNWVVINANEISPNEKSRASEIAMIAYKKKGEGIEINAEWSHYVDIGDKRDLAIFDITITKNQEKHKFQLGSIHTTPDCPRRDTQLLGISKWAESQNGNFIITGDFNWGYASNRKKCTDGDTYIGELALKKLHKDEKVFQLFYNLSFEKKPSKGDLRTNLGIRKTARFYDQFLISKEYSKKMADGGKFMEDCGIRSFSQGKEYNKISEKYVKEQMKGLELYAKKKGIDTSDSNWKIDKKEIEKSLLSKAKANPVTYRISDHRIVWMQIKF